MRTAAWVTGGLGSGGNRASSGRVYVGQLSGWTSRDQVAVGVRIAIAEGPRRAAQEASLLIGRQLRRDDDFAVMALGVAYTDGWTGPGLGCVLTCEGARRGLARKGAPALAVEWSNTARFVGVGLGMTAVGGVANYIGITFSLSLGRFG